MPTSTYSLLSHLSSTESTSVDVYQHLPTQTPVVIKSMDRYCSSTRKELKTHQRLLKAKESLDSILPLQEKIKHKNRLHCVFPYYEKGDLYHYFVNNHVPASEIQQFFTQIVQAVAFCHSNGYAHMDLSLENILLDANNDCKLCDFGLANKAHKTSTQRVGKLFYMAPEVCTRQRYVPATADMWSLGIMLFTMFTGNPLFEQANGHDPRYALFQKYGTIVPLLKVWEYGDRIPQDVVTLIDALLSLNPSKRPTIFELQSHPWLLPTESKQSEKGLSVKLSLFQKVGKWFKRK